MNTVYAQIVYAPYGTCLTYITHPQSIYIGYSINIYIYSISKWTLFMYNVRHMSNRHHAPSECVTSHANTIRGIFHLHVNSVSLPPSLAMYVYITHPQSASHCMQAPVATLTGAFARVPTQHAYWHGPSRQSEASGAGIHALSGRVSKETYLHGKRGLLTLA